jgi:hypothetical protein
MKFSPRNALLVGLVTCIAGCGDDDGTGAETSTKTNTSSTSTNTTSTDSNESSTQDDVRIKATPWSVSVVEGASATFKVMLTAAPTAPTTVKIRASGDPDVSVSSVSELTFTPMDWSSAQTVTVSAALDADTINGSATLSLEATGVPTETVSVNEVDNTVHEEMPHLIVTPEALSVTEAATATFSVALSSAPSAMTTVGVAYSAGDTDISVSGGASLVFSAVNWNTPQTVTLAAATDSDTANGSATITVSAPGLMSREVTATEMDTTVLGIVVGAPALSVPESSSATFTVALNAQPPGDTLVNVTKDAGGDDDLTISSGAALTFTPANWNVPQVVTVAAAADVDASNGSATLSVASTGLTTQKVVASEVDASVLGLVVTPLALPVAEGATANFTVVLNARPDAATEVSVTKAVGGDADLNLKAGAALNFTTENWNVPQTVTIASDVDLDAENGQATFKVAGAGVMSQEVVATEVDSIAQGLVVTPLSLDVKEGESKSFSVALAAKPSGDVVVNLEKDSGGDSDLSVEGSGKLTFTPLNWNVPKNVVIAAAQDDDAINGTATVSVSSIGLPTKVVNVSEEDDDTLEFHVRPISGMVLENGMTTFFVSLTAQPAASTTVGLTKVTGGDADITPIGTSSLVFTTSNWNVPQPFIVSAAADDGDMVNGQAAYKASAIGLTPRTISVTEADDDQVGFLVSALEIDVPEGFQSTFTVALTKLPAGTVNVSVVRSAGDNDLRVISGGALEFTTTNWSSPQTVTLQALEDTGNTSDSATLKISATDLSDVTVKLNEVDNDLE